MAGTVAVAVTAATLAGGDVQELPVLISVSTPEGTVRTASDICCVIDISWSMSMEATVQTSSGLVESNGLSMLDIAKHAVRTVIRSLGPEDRICFVQFCRGAAVMLPLTAMTPEGQKSAEEKLDTIGFGSGTALWQGLEKGLTLLRDGASPDRLGHMILLTDGETEDKDVVMRNLKEVKMLYERLPGTISAFGFGYEIDSSLLVEIADFSNGSYAFIPDAGFVGTIFVNSMSNLLVTFARDAWLTVEADFGAEILEVAGGWAHARKDGVVSLNLGTLQYGQTKDVIVRMKAVPADAPYLLASLRYSTLHGDLSVRSESMSIADAKADETIQLQCCRSLFIDALLRATTAGAPATEDALQLAREIVREAGAKVAASPASKTEKGAALLEDILGQSCEALSRLDYWTKWGRHYTPSVMFAHKLQQCNNFKDPGVQFYGGKLFGELRDVADAAFDALPAPKVTPAMYRYLGGGKVVANRDYSRDTRGARTASAAGAAGAATSTYAPSAVSMAAYNDRYGGCICGASSVKLASGLTCRVDELAQGTRVATHKGGEAEVVCVVRTRCVGGRAWLVELPGGTRLTPYHPVYVDGAWRFPAHLGSAREFDCQAIYSFVLRGAPDLVVGGVPCVALGHGVQEGAAKHPYYGTSKVLEDIAKMHGFFAGVVELDACCAVRDPDTGLVVGLRHADPTLAVVA